MMLFENGKRLLVLLVLLAAAAPAAFSQHAQLSGKVSDPSGASIPRAEINVVNLENGTRRNVATNEEGFYNVPSLQPGRYRVVAQKEGFRPLSREGITLQVGDNVKLDLNMEVGAVSDQVTITAEAPLLRTDDVQTGQVIDNRRIQELPQYNRNVLAFAQLAAGVSGSADQPGVSMYYAPNDFRINGGRTTQSEYYVDGSPVTDGYSRSIAPSIPSPEAVQEFKVVTNGLSAEYGRLSGGAVTLVTRAGTNQYHGSAYEFFKNDKLNANDWNSNRLGKPKGAFHNNIFGGSFGGSVRVPKLYDGRDKTFFFLNYEGNRFSAGSNSAVAGVPTLLERNGDFTESLVDQGKPARIYDPATGAIQGTEVIRQPFPGNKIPAGRISPIAKIYNGYYPEPNLTPRPGSSHEQNYVGASTSEYSNDRWTGRMDQNWSPGQTTYFTITHFNDHQAYPSWLGPMAASSDLAQAAKTAALNHVATLSPSTVLTLRFGIMRNTGPGAGTMVGLRGYSTLSPEIDSGGWGFQPEIYSILGTTKGRAPAIVMRDDYAVASLGGGGGALTYETDYSGGASLQTLLGKHSLKVGWEHRRYYTNQYAGGNFQISSERPVTQMNALNFDGSGSGYASFLLGLTTWGGGNQYGGPASLQTYHAAYIQDDIKVSRKLTINAGLRWDFEPPRTERTNRQIFWDSRYVWDARPAAGWSWDKVLQQAGVTGSVPQPLWMTQGFLGRPALMGSDAYPERTIQQDYPFHFSPRFGLAYQIRPQTVVRVSYGLNWMSLAGSQFLNNATWNNGYTDKISVQRGTADNGLTYPRTFQQVVLPGGDGLIPAANGKQSVITNTALGSWYLSQAVNSYPGYEHLFQFSLQHQLGAGANAWVVEANLSANLGRQLPFWLGNGEIIMQDAYNKIGGLGLKLNALVDNPVYGLVPSGWANTGPKTQLGRVLTNNPLYGEVWTMGGAYGRSNYTAAFIQAEHRFAGGFGLLANYTFSKLLQDVGSQDSNVWDNNGYPQAGLPLSDVYGVAPNDRAHRFLVNYSLDLPVGRGKPLLGDPQGVAGNILDKVVGGWTIAGTTIFRSGTPLGMSGGGNFWANLGQGRTPLRGVFRNREFDNNVSGHTALIGSAGSTPFFKPGSFAIVQGAQIGDVPATMPYLRGPAFSQWDFAIMKHFALWSESSQLQLRLEAQNAFNHMNTANPDTNQTAATFGYIVGQSGTPRVVMISAKFVF